MNAPTRSEPMVVARYSETLEALRPGCNEVERRRRCGILYMRDRATAALRVAGWEAAGILKHVEALGCVHAFATMPPDQLEQLHHSMIRLMRVAMSLDTHGPRGNL